MVGLAHDLEGNTITPWDVSGDGTRHRSVYRLCSVEPEAIGLVISQDSQVRMIANGDVNGDKSCKVMWLRVGRLP